MTNRVRLRPRDHAAITMAALVLATVGVSTAHHLSSATGTSPTGPWTTVFATGFTSEGDADAFTSPGPGTWSVERGAYVLNPAEGAAQSRADQPLSLLRAPVSSRSWRLRAVLQARGGTPDASIVFGYRSRDHYWFAHLDARATARGVYRVTDGRALKVSPLGIDFRPRADYVVQIRAGNAGTNIRIGRTGQALQRVAHVDAKPTRTSRVGFGSWHSEIRVNSLHLRARPTVPPPTGTPTATTSVTPVVGLRNITVSTSEQLTAALADARPGDAITMLDGTYTTKGLAAPLVVGGKHYVGTFVGSVSGTAEHPIVLQGSAGAVIDGKPGEDGTGTQYGLYLADVDHWQVRGITVRNASKGIVLDQSNHVRLDGVQVHDTGQEGIHLRAFSSDNIVIGCTVTRTGLSNATYGEGIYVGSANSNWGTYSGGIPDASDRNQLLANTISQTSAESMDIKEGTTEGLIQGNSFDGAGMTGSWADSWIDMKGNGWTVQGNYGVNALQDGFQVHGALAGWGLNNIFRDNTADVRGPGYGFWLQSNVAGNAIACANTVLNATAGFANIPCTKV